MYPLSLFCSGKRRGMLTAGAWGCNGAFEVESEVRGEAGATPLVAPWCRRSRPRSGTRRIRARHPHCAYRHSGARRVAGEFHSRRQRAELGCRHQSERRASRLADDFGPRCGQGGHRLADAARRSFPAAAARRISGRFAGHARAGERPRGGSEHCRQPARPARRRRGAAARGSREPDRQRRQVHRARRRAARGARLAGRTRTHAARCRGARQRHRPQAGRDQTVVPSVRPGQRRDRAPLWRLGARPCHRQAPRQADGRRSDGGEHAGPRLVLPLHRRDADRVRRRGCQPERARHARRRRARSRSCVQRTTPTAVSFSTLSSPNSAIAPTSSIPARTPWRP